MSPFGRKRPFISLVFAVPERPLSGKADIQISVAKNSCGAAAFGRKRLEAFTTAARKVPGSLSRSFSRPREIKKPPEPLELVVPGAGIEPALPLRNRILSPARLPVPPPRHGVVGMFEQAEPGSNGAQYMRKSLRIYTYLRTTRRD